MDDVSVVSTFRNNHTRVAPAVFEFGLSCDAVRRDFCFGSIGQAEIAYCVVIIFRPPRCGATFGDIRVMSPGENVVYCTRNLVNLDSIRAPEALWCVP